MIIIAGYMFWLAEKYRISKMLSQLIYLCVFVFNTCAKYFWTLRRYLSCQKLFYFSHEMQCLTIIAVDSFNLIWSDSDRTKKRHIPLFFKNRTKKTQNKRLMCENCVIISEKCVWMNLWAYYLHGMNTASW